MQPAICINTGRKVESHVSGMNPGAPSTAYRHDYRGVRALGDGFEGGARGVGGIAAADADIRWKVGIKFACVWRWASDTLRWLSVTEQHWFPFWDTGYFNAYLTLFLKTKYP